MNKYLHAVLVSGLTLALVPVSSAHIGDGVLTPSDVLEEIRVAQNAAFVSDIDCGLVTYEQLEELGDAWMETVHPGEEHEFMDQMMGGEGSESLRVAHVQMGARYLGCGGYDGRGGMMGSSGMMRPGAAWPVSGASRTSVWLLVGVAAIVILLKAVKKN